MNGGASRLPTSLQGYGLVAALWGALVFGEIKVRSAVLGITSAERLAANVQSVSPQGSISCFVFSLASCVVLIGSLLTAVSRL